MTRIDSNMRRGLGVLAASAGLLLLSAGPALAYVGPGAGLSLLGALWGVAVAVIAALAFVVIWPIRRMMKRRSVPAPATRNTQSSAARERAPLS